ncbi:MAG: amidohydrolase [Chloroflexota bacterium]|nr:amidohydrolase [Chloroflexota bacterium]
MPRIQHLGVGQDRLSIIDVHTHASGDGADGPPDDVVSCMDACGVEQVFLFAPLLGVHGLALTDKHFDDIRRHNDYIAHFCSPAPERLLAFAVLNPNPNLAGGDPDAATQLMIQEARRCYHELGIRGVKMVPDCWTVDAPHVLPLLIELADLGMYVAFHSGIFLDERSSTYCRPASYEAVHRVPGFHGHLAHLSWPWVDECIATLAMETFHAHEVDHDHWQLKADLSFGCPADWQVDSVRKALDMLPHDMLMYASDVFWPCDPVRYLEEFIYPQLSTFEAAATLSRTAPNQGSAERVALRRAIFYANAAAHWEAATRGKPQQPLRQTVSPRTPHARQRRGAAGQRMRSPAILPGINQPRQTM